MVILCKAFLGALLGVEKAFQLHLDFVNVRHYLLSCDFESHQVATAFADV